MINIKVGDHVISPGHGVGVVLEMEDRLIQEKPQTLIVLKILGNGMTLIKPVETVRPISSKKKIQEARSIINSKPKSIPHLPWRIRYRSYLDMVNSGDIIKIAKVISLLEAVKSQNKLTYGEKHLLKTCMGIFEEEASLST